VRFSRSLRSLFPAFSLADVFFFFVLSFRFDRYAECDTSEYGQTGPDPHGGLFRESSLCWLALPPPPLTFSPALFSSFLLADF